jgi:hypothetical protein
LTYYKNDLKNIVYIRTIMPNECSNRVTITSTNENDITYILQEINVEIPDVIVTQSSKLGIRLEFITAWKPDIQFIDTLINKYPLSWIKNEWISEDGKCGIWVGNKNNIKFMDWEDLSIEDEQHFFHK